MNSIVSASSSINTESIRFVLDGKTVTVTDQSPTLTVLEYLRDIAGRTGSKEGCAEGDCGACTVVLGELAADQTTINYCAVNSCIRFLPTIDGKELITVESLQASDGALHPVQQAMVDQHASQCGFCTPGFVMSLFALYLNQSSTARAEVVNTLSGNLCRCTGYRPIIEAGCRMIDYPEPQHWSRSAAHSTAHLAALQSIQRGTTPANALRLSGFRAPRTLDELAATLESAPHSLILAGGTDVGLWVTKHLRDLPPMVYLGEVAELKEIYSTEDELRIGAAVSLSSAWSALVGLHPMLAEQAQRFASPPVCNSGTLCGNLANGSPIGDSIPALIALGAEVELRLGSRIRRIALERLYRGYQQKDLAPGEFVVSVTVKPPAPGRLYASYKVAKRIDQDISAVNAGFSIALESGRVVDARLAYGGMAATPARASRTEAALIGQLWSSVAIDAAISALAQDFQPLTDLRASHDYRLRTAGNLLHRFYLQHSDASNTLRTADAVASVYSP
jgi:xanthine dehydrogenase small subunit